MLLVSFRMLSSLTASAQSRLGGFGTGHGPVRVLLFIDMFHVQCCFPCLQDTEVYHYPPLGTDIAIMKIPVNWVEGRDAHIAQVAEKCVDLLQDSHVIVPVGRLCLCSSVADYGCRPELSFTIFV